MQAKYQKLGNLPFYRVNKPDKPFRLSGVDYAGSYSILKYRGRGAKKIKGYIVILICLSTKAVHFELVSGYLSDDFLAAFRQFTFTRGPCSKLYSDQGTTFVGANKELQELYSKSTSYILDLAKKLVDVGTTWSFNLPGAPHFGGIW